MDLQVRITDGRPSPGCCSTPPEHSPLRCCRAAIWCLYSASSTAFCSPLFCARSVSISCMSAAAPCSLATYAQTISTVSVHTKYYIHRLHVTQTICQRRHRHLTCLSCASRSRVAVACLSRCCMIFSSFSSQSCNSCSSSSLAVTLSSSSASCTA